MVSSAQPFPDADFELMGRRRFLGTIHETRLNGENRLFAVCIGGTRTMRYDLRGHIPGLLRRSCRGNAKSGSATKGNLPLFFLKNPKKEEADKDTRDKLGSNK